ncbi:MAG: hypothetical protein B5M53_03215 [Candidatus Cloacimonas sp. 4484_209]|nr:MAG: hypothetical protein B5M53_03215 [Candidatus Cloacimonas sp. 4484_209]
MTMLNFKEEKLRIFSIRRQQDFILPSYEVLIDSRILMVLKTGFIKETIVLPQFLIEHIKENASAKSSNIPAKRGIMVVESLINDENYNVIIDKTEFKGLEGLNRKIVHLAVKKKYRLLAIDNELEPYTKIVGVEVLKLNELSMALKKVFFKGDVITVKPIKRGRYTGEGIGYLDDNSTVIIEGASTSLGKIIKCEVISVLDLPTGRVIFAKI